MDQTSAPSKKSKIQLITIDADQKLWHFQECKITINKIAKFLLMEPQIKNIKVLVASFDKSFYRFKNILCILDSEENIYNFMLILRNTESCEKVFDVIQKSKEIKDTDLSNEKLLQQLIFPILKEIQINQKLETEIKLTLRKLFKSFNNEEKQKCRKHLKRIQMDKNLIVEIFGKNVTQAPELKSESIPKRKEKQNKTVNDEIIIEAPNFKVINFTENGNERKRLFIFDEIDKTKCYEYSMQKGSNNYSCLGCGRKKKTVSTKLIKKGGKEYVKFNKSMHICELRNFNLNKYFPEITEAPNFKVVNFKENGAVKKRLLIFDEKNKNKCYEYYWLESNQYFKCLGCHTKNVNTTTGIYKENGKEFVKLKKLTHVCEIRDYNPSKYSIDESPDTNMDEKKSSKRKRKRTEDVDEKEHVKLEKPNNVCENNPVLPKIIKASNFKIYNFEEKGIKKSKLFIFNVEDKSMGYEYYWSGSMKSYRCSRCEKRGKNSTAKICKRSGGNDFIELNTVNHICEMIKYNYGKYNFDASKQIIKEPNFEVHDFQDRGILRKWLVIFPLIEDRSKCYEYSWIKRDKKYECRGCKAMKINVFAELCQNKNGTKYVKLGPQKHGCEYRKYNPQKFTSEEIVEAQNFEIVNFEENGIAKKRLFIFVNSEKTKCYEFYWRNVGKYFMCSPCEIKNKHTAAKLEERKDGTKYIRLMSPKHICEVKDYVPKKYSFDESKRIVEKPNFEIYDYVKNDVSKSMLIIFCATNKELCYEYFWEKHAQVYVCCGCANIIHVTAKLCKNDNGEEYLRLNKTEHVCELRPFEPQKFIDNLKIDKSDYETSEYSYNGISSKRLFIFTTKSKEFCYKFYYNSTENFYYCSKCRQMNQHLKAHIRENDDGNEYVSVSSKKHVCEPIKYNPKKRILSPNFQLLKRKSRNLIIQKLIVFIDSNHEMCYEYRQSETNFVCASPSKFKCPASAKMLQNSIGEDYVEMSYVKHKCKPIKFVPEGNLDFKIIKKPDFKLDGNVLSIFDKNDKTKCYTYKWKEHGKLYQCYSCRYKNESVSVVARIKQNEDGEDYVLLNDNEHFCQPKKYQPLKK